MLSMSQFLCLCLLCFFVASITAAPFIPKLYYFNIPGKAEAIRLACIHSNFIFEDIRLSRQEFTDMKNSGRLQFGQVPAMEVREGVMLTQSAAILRFIGKKTDLYPVDDEVAAAVDAIIDQETDLFAGLTVAKYPERFGFGQLDSIDDTIVKYIHEDIMTETVIRHLRQFEALLTVHNSESKSALAPLWIASTVSPTIADFTLLPRLKELQTYIMSEMDFDVMLIFPQLNNLVDRFYGMPQITCYYSGDGDTCAAFN